MSVLLRGLLLAGGLSCVLWSLVIGPSFWEMVPARDAATRIIADERFKPGTLADVLRRIEAKLELELSQPELAWARALIQLRIAEEAMARKGSEEADGQIFKAEESVQAALAVSPSDSFLWVLLYSVQATRNGFAPQSVRYLGQSYVAGPLEGWISMRRNRLALAVFPILNGTTQTAVIAEFAKMVDADFIEDAALNLTGKGWQQREQLLAALGSVDLASKQALYKRLAIEGMRLSVPGVVEDERPWRR
ncbi:hypothetical protein [Bradyrhizobium ottawaense]|uniref:hypothetical protein n=1 Tax=Bradyrhizobium ottawaense TaxID=931866 RepID=UPI001BAD8B3C|nr:hypothetical protein [Bradyrhizobium ottawaense]MBR1292474.1 hypothetical protein [Bradyrhizobium ottawaense]